MSCVKCLRKKLRARGIAIDASWSAADMRRILRAHVEFAPPLDNGEPKSAASVGAEVE